ncbi:type 4b pilus protein PilO2 [Pandoraea fibrosis]|uniref:Type 4b pilus protein PilO2 n=1 Tax=Pandoraea fibrosis TaxID=1891094 RepID=A0ABX6HLK1_9BURK|nr:type 4b pilus protein PilO2 [Pandoraea fibrosis]QHE90552.1 type 4b pilus protein PilO2 [Pandoraea fibrosis]QHF11384.1 type 4b pilus protein PilO2 [Pandoraea fibrosis]
MTRILSNQLVVGAQWETLIGLQKEPTEIRGLARSRDASHYAVADDGAGTRTAGLFSLDLSVNVQSGLEWYALGAVLGEMIDAPNVAFVHPDPDDASAMVLVTLRDRRPELDLIVPTSELGTRLEQWAAEIESGIKIVGVAPLNGSGVDLTLTLDDIAAQVRKEPPRDARLLAVRKPLPARKLKLAAISLAALSLLSMAGWWGWSWYEAQQQAKLAAANRVDPVDAYRSALARAIAAEPFSAGASYARRVQYAVQSLPASAGGWRPASIECRGDRCEIQWRRQEGGTFDLLLSQRPNAQIVDLDNAREIMTPADTLPPVSAPARAMPVATDAEGLADNEDEVDDGDARVTPVPRTQFLRTAGARLQSLGDYGMDISLSMPQPLVQAPQAVTTRSDVPPPIAKGEWKMAGHLAFVDSVAGLMMRAGNMSLHELTIVIDDTKPVFSARGTYYVH